MVSNTVDRYDVGAPEADLTPDEVEAWIEANSPPLNSFPLDTHEGRLGFLREQFMRGYPALFEGVSHVWKLLESPKEARCFGIGLAAGTGGKGKAALMKFLSKVIDEGLATFTPIPPIDNYPSVHEWNETVKEDYRNDEIKLTVVLERYAYLLVAHPFGPKPSVKMGQVIHGPWNPSVTVAEPPHQHCEGATGPFALAGVEDVID